MMHFVRFEKSVQKADLLNPSNGFKPQSQSVERRKDTLTDRWCRINIERANRPKDRVGDASVLQLVESSRIGCPFCPDRLATSTPMFPESLVREGRLKVGEAIAFPNLFVFAQYHSVVVLTGEHYQPLDRFKPECIRNGFDVAIRYLKAVAESNPLVRYCSINWNSLPTAGASMIHPHLQVIADVAPTKYVGEILDASEAFHRKHGVSYWDDLVEAEKENGERFIADFGGSKWLTSFCGLGNNDVLGVLDVSNIFELSGSTLDDLSDGLSAMLRGYQSIGVQGFNISLYSGPMDSYTPHFRVHVRMISRPDPRPMYTSDAGFLERLHDEVVVETRPEDVALKIRTTVSR